MDTAPRHPEFEPLTTVAPDFGFTARTLQKHIRAGQLPAYRKGRRYLVRRHEVRRFVELQRVQVEREAAAAGQSLDQVVEAALGANWKEELKVVRTAYRKAQLEKQATPPDEAA